MNPVLSNDYFLTTVKCGATTAPSPARKFRIDLSGTVRSMKFASSYRNIEHFPRSNLTKTRAYGTRTRHDDHSGQRDLVFFCAA